MQFTSIKSANGIIMTIAMLYLWHNLYELQSTLPDIPSHPFASVTYRTPNVKSSSFIIFSFNRMDVHPVSRKTDASFLFTLPFSIFRPTLFVSLSTFVVLWLHRHWNFWLFLVIEDDWINFTMSLLSAWCWPDLSFPPHCFPLVVSLSVVQRNRELFLIWPNLWHK